MAQNKKIFVFDFDGTLADSMGWLARLAAEVLAEYYQLPLAEGRKLYLKTSGLPFCEQVAMLFPKQTSKNREADQTFERRKRENYFSQPLYADTRPTLQCLKEKGYTVVISSNSAQELVEKSVKISEIPCDLALGYKPNFAKGLHHFLYILNRFGVNRSQIVFIGDSIKDGERAKENQIDFIAKTGTFAKADFQKHFPNAPVISALAELKETFS